MKVTVRKAVCEDIDGIFKIEKSSFTNNWSYESLYEDICKTPISYYLVAETEGNILGCIGMWHVMDEAHIMNVAVDSGFRHLGIGSMLLSTLIEYAEDCGILRMTLEVREHNYNAISLYEKYGFLKYGKRKQYYQDTFEDAIIMWKEL